MIPKELEALILRLHHNEGWPVGTIASQLELHHETVERVLAQEGLPLTVSARARLIDPYVDFIKDTWQRYPKLPATRLWKMCQLRGYSGAKDHFRAAARPYRPAPKPEAFLRLATLPAEQAQVDWAHFGRISFKRCDRPLLAFVAVLSYSRALFAQFYLGQQVENLLRGLQGAFEFWGGHPRVVLFDNPKTVVLERVADAIRFNPKLIDFSMRYRFDPRPVAPHRGNEKGRVERAIRYMRSSFFMARRWKDLDDLNQQALEWCRGEALQRCWPQDCDQTLAQVYERERAQLHELPADPPVIEERCEVAVGKTPYVRFDRNDYSVPPELVRKTLQVAASLEFVRVLHEGRELARHRRSYDRGDQIEDEAHIASLQASKRQSRAERGLDRLSHAVPSAAAFMEKVAEQGKSLGGATASLLKLLSSYGAERLEVAIREAMERGRPWLHEVYRALEHEQKASGQPPPMPGREPPEAKRRGLSVRPHPLASYDVLTQRPQKENDDG